MNQSIEALLIEDNPADARLIEEQLQPLGVDIRLSHAATLKSAMALLEQRATDVILADLCLPDSVGLDSLKRLRRARPEIPTIVLTGVLDETLVERARRLGAHDCLIKGQIDGDGLVASLRSAVGRWHARARVYQMPGCGSASIESRRGYSSLAALSAELMHRCRQEYIEMPGLQLTLGQASRLWNLDVLVCANVLSALVACGFLDKTRDRYVRAN